MTDFNHTPPQGVIKFFHNPSRTHSDYDLGHAGLAQLVSFPGFFLCDVLYQIVAINYRQNYKFWINDHGCRKISQLVDDYRVSLCQLKKNSTKNALCR